MPDHVSFGYWVRRRRKALDWTQADLGRRVGASAAMIRKIEAGERRPSRELADLLAEHLAVPANEREAFLRAARDTATLGYLQPPPEIASQASHDASPINNLPTPMTSLVNRVHDLATVKKLLLSEQARLVTLLGPPGMGKTRLSIQVAESSLPHFPDGVWFVDLSAVSDPALVLPTIALTLNFPLESGQSPDSQLRNELRDRQVLLVLDNFEQVVDAAAGEVAALLRACKRLKLLVTSRIRLDVYGEFEYPLPPMTVPPLMEQVDPGELLRYEAVQLFVARAKQHSPDFALTPGTAAPVAEICRRMEGVPLALELAAAQTRRLEVDQLATSLRNASGYDWNSLLHTSARDIPPRQQTLFNAIAWSYSLLPPEQQELLRRLSVFAGSFDLPAVAAVMTGEKFMDESTLRDALEQLIEHNLVSEVSRSPARWRLLEMIREFSLARMDGSEHQTAIQNHLRHYAVRQSDWYADWLDPAYIDTVEDDLDNYRTALDHAIEAGDSPAAHWLGATMGRFWERRGLLKEGRAMLDKVLAMPGAVDPKARFTVVHEATILAWMQHDFERAESLAVDALTWAHGQQSNHAVTVVLNMLGRIYIEQQRYEEADGVLSEAIKLGSEADSPGTAGMQIVQRGEVALAQGDLDRAEILTRAGLATVTESDLIPFCLGWNNLAEIALAKGDIASASHALRRVLPLAHLHSRRIRIFLNAVAGLLLAKTPSSGQAMVDALRLLIYVQATNDKLGDPLSPMTQKLLASRIDLSHTQLTSELWQTTCAEGRRMTQEEALAIARKVLTDNFS